MEVGKGIGFFKNDALVNLNFSILVSMVICRWGVYFFFENCNLGWGGVYVI